MTPDEERDGKFGSDPGGDADESDADETDDSEDEEDLVGDDADDADITEPDLPEQVIALSNRVAALTDILSARDDLSKRQMNQVKGLQTSLSKLETRVGGAPSQASVDSLTEVVSTLIEAVATEDMPQASRDRLTRAQAESRQGAAINEAVKRVKAELPAAADEDASDDDAEDETSDSLAPNEVASMQVFAYAEGKGISAEELMRALPRSEWAKVQADSSSFADAVKILKQKVDGVATAKAAARRRSGKKVEGAKGGTPAKSGTGGALPSKKQLAKMDLPDVMKLTPAQRAEILAGD